MSSPIEKLSGIFTDYNALISRAKVQHKEIDIRIMQTSLHEIIAGQRQREFLSEIQSCINEIKETKEDAFENPYDQKLLRELKLKIEELVSELFLQCRKRGREDESSQEPPLKIHVPPTVQLEKVRKRGREVESEEVESIKKQKPFDIIFAKYCSQEMPKDDAHVRAILRDINDGGRKKAFFIISGEENFTLYVLENGEIKLKLLSLDDSGQCTLHSDLRQESAAEKFNSFDEMKKNLGTFGLDALNSIQNEKAIMARYGVKFEPDRTALQTACSCLNKDLIRDLLDKNELDIPMLKKCWDVFDEAMSKKPNPNHIEECKKVLIKYATDNGISLNSVIKGVDTTLFSELFQFKDEKFVADLIVKSIEKYPGLVLQNKDGDTPLHWAATKGHTEIAKLLIAKDAGLSLQNRFGMTPLYLAIAKDNTEVAKLLIEKGIGLDLQNNYGFTPLHLATLKNNTEIAKLLIAKYAGLSLKNSFGATPLHLAIDKGRPEIAKLLVAKDAGLSLHQAIESGNVALAKRLIIEYDANVNQCNNQGINPLHLACKQGLLEVVELILKSSNKNTLDGKNEHNNTPLMVALLNDHEEVASLLIKNGADLAITYKNKQTALHIACKKGLVNVTKAILDKNANNDIADKNGNTPLDIALKNGQLACAKLLIDSGTDISNLQLHADFITSIKTDNPESIPMNVFIEEVDKIYKNSFSKFCDATKSVINQQINLADTDFEKMLTPASQTFNEKFKLVIQKANRNPDNIADYKTELLTNIQSLYLSCILLLQQDLIKFMSSEKGRARWDHFTPTLEALNETYKVSQEKFLKNQCNNSLVMLEKFLQIGRFKTIKEIQVFAEIVTYQFPTLPNGVKKYDLYLEIGVCYGASIEKCAYEIANESISDETGKNSAEFYIYPNRNSRFLQAAHIMSMNLPNLISKKFKKNGLKFKDETISFAKIDEFFQKKLGIKIESTKKISEQSVTDFIKNIDTLIPKLNTELSTNFTLITKIPGIMEHGSHAIYCHLSPPYEIQDVNYPNFFPQFSVLKTEDLHQFQMYLTFYFLEMAPCDYQTIDDLMRVSKGISLTPPKLKAVQERKFTIPKHLDNMKTEEKKAYLTERDKISQELESLGDKENVVLYRNYYLELFDELVSMHVANKSDTEMYKYLESKQISTKAKNNLKDSIRKIFEDNPLHKSE